MALKIMALKFGTTPTTPTTGTKRTTWPSLSVPKGTYSGAVLTIVESGERIAHGKGMCIGKGVWGGRTMNAQ